MHVSTTKHSSRTSIESMARLASTGSRVAVFVLATCSGVVSVRCISDESVNAAVTIGSGSCETGVASAAGSATDLLIVDTSAVPISDDPVNAALTVGSGSRAAAVASAASVSVADLPIVTSSVMPSAIGGGLSADVASAASSGTRRSPISAAPVLSIPAKPNAAIHARTKEGIATSRHKAAVAANRGFMITVSNWAGLHSRACDAKDLWRDDVDKQWRKTSDIPFSNGCCFNATCRLFATCRENRSLLKARTVEGPDSSLEG